MADGTDTVSAKKKSLVRRLCTRAVDALVPSDDDARERGRWIERKLQSLMLTLATCAILWGVHQLASIDRIANKVDELSIQLDGTYRADMARRDMQYLAQRIDAGDARDAEYDKRLDTVERRIDRVEYVLDTAPATLRYMRSKAAAVTPRVDVGPSK